ncbi:MAG: sugar transferase [Bacteroidales bacterium]|nr:sugar transferase [Bacteroidales bacterium]
MYIKTKRVFDFIVSLLLIVLLLPLIVFIVILLLLFNHCEVFYLQTRIGLNNTYFKIFKFSSMLKGSLSMPGGAITLRNDPRVTKLGKFLRITKLNELPQLFNVLLGSMSFVGPRPIMDDGFSLYSTDAQKVLYTSKPGITGISSVVFRDEELIVTNSGVVPFLFYKEFVFPYKSKLEIWYYKNKSFLVDIAILFLTGIKIIVPSSKLEFKIFSSLPKSEFFNF